MLVSTKLARSSTLAAQYGRYCAKLRSGRTGHVRQGASPADRVPRPGHGCPRERRHRACTICAATSGCEHHFRTTHMCICYTPCTVGAGSIGGSQVPVHKTPMPAFPNNTVAGARGRAAAVRIIHRTGRRTVCHCSAGAETQFSQVCIYADGPYFIPC